MNKVLVLIAALVFSCSPKYTASFQDYKPEFSSYMIVESPLALKGHNFLTTDSITTRVSSGIILASAENIPMATSRGDYYRIVPNKSIRPEIKQNKLLKKQPRKDGEKSGKKIFTVSIFLLVAGILVFTVALILLISILVKAAE
jgi:ribosomal protein S9